jgi:hypothetical protein
MDKNQPKGVLVIKNTAGYWGNSGQVTLFSTVWLASSALFF